MKSIIIGILFFFSLNLGAQEESIRYFKDKYRTQETTNIKKAKSKSITTVKDGISTNRSFLLKRGKEDLYSVEYYKGEEPVGKWQYFKEGKLAREVDYSDTLVYNENKVDSEFYFKLDKEMSTEKEGMTPPQLKGYETIFHAIYGNLKYPAYARSNGIQGQVLLNIKITKEGKAIPISVLRGTHPSIDKAAWMAVRSCDTWEPAMYNGEAIDSYAVFPIKFKLEG